MLFAKPSQSALGVAMQRALHQLHDKKPLIFEDPIAVPILGKTYRNALEKNSAWINEMPFPALRCWLALRSRYTEAILAEAAGRGVRQYVLLGAGLDTFAYRNPHKSLQVFEVDQPATLRWKRRLSAVAGLVRSKTQHYVPIDFRSQKLNRELDKNGLDFAAPTVFAWLGVSYFLPQAAFRATLEVVSNFPSGSSLLMDYWLPQETLGSPARETQHFLADLVAKHGETYQSFFTQTQMAHELDLFASVQDLGADELNHLYVVCPDQDNGQESVESQLGFCRMVHAHR